MYIENKVNACFERMLSLCSIDEYKKKFIVIFGMNESAKMEIAFFHFYGIKIGAIVDNNTNIQGLHYNGEEINKPNDILGELPQNSLILVSARLAKDSIVSDILKYNADYINFIKYSNLYEIIEKKSLFLNEKKEARCGLEKIKQENLNMLIWLSNLCKKNNLRCYLSYGTLLGAIRHQGFIPWDDDVDVSMPFPDYMKLHEIIKEDDEFYFDSIFNKKQGTPAISTIAKLKSRRVVIEEYNFPIYYEDNLAIDIWPLGGFPDDNEASKRYYRELQELADLWKEKVVISYGTDKFNLAEYNKLVEILAHAMGRYDYDKSNYVSEVYCGYLDHIRKDLKRRGIPKKNFETTVEVDFEGEKFAVPCGYDEILKSKYGQYMEIPEDCEKRVHGYSNTAFWVGDINYFGRDTKYWNNFYVKTRDLNIPSLFAQACISYMKKGDFLVELGCGNGRDSKYFVEKGINVTAIDASSVAIDMLKIEMKSNNISLICGDFVTCIKNYKDKFDDCYSRFSIHAITEEQETLLIKNVYASLKQGGKFFVEVRSVNDDIYGLGTKVGRNSYEYDGHFRRFIVKSELQEKMVGAGFRVLYSAESCGFAPFKEKDPQIIRIIAEK